MSGPLQRAAPFLLHLVRGGAPDEYDGPAVGDDEDEAEDEGEETEEIGRPARGPGRRGLAILACMHVHARLEIAFCYFAPTVSRNVHFSTCIRGGSFFSPFVGRDHRRIAAVLVGGGPRGAPPRGPHARRHCGPRRARTARARPRPRRRRPQVRTLNTMPFPSYHLLCAGRREGVRWDEGN